MPDFASRPVTTACPSAVNTKSVIANMNRSPVVRYDTLGRLKFMLKRNAMRVKIDAVEMAICDGRNDGSIQKTHQAMRAIKTIGMNIVRR